MTCRDEHWAELVVGRALDALEPGDDALIDRHLTGCDDCTALLGDMRRTASSLAYGAADMEPPPELLDRIRASLPPRLPVAATPLPDIPQAQTPLVLDELAVRRGQPRRRHRRPIVRAVAGLSAVAAVAAVVVVGGIAVSATRDRDHAHQSLAAEASVIRELQDDSAYRVVLSSSGPAGGFAVVQGRSVSLITNGLDDNDRKSSIYVLWAASRSGAPMTAVTGFDIRGDGTAVVTATLPDSVRSPKIFGVTEERGRTLPATPGRPVLGVSNSDA